MVFPPITAARRHMTRRPKPDPYANAQTTINKRESRQVEAEIARMKEAIKTGLKTMCLKEILDLYTSVVNMRGVRGKP